MHNKSVAAKSHYAFKSNFWGSPQFDVLNCINEIPDKEFKLNDVYRFIEVLKEKHINNNHIEAKIRQQLQLLRDKGYIEFLERGHYRKINL